MSPELPNGWGPQHPFEAEGVRGYRYGDLDPSLLELVPGWVRDARVDGGEDLRAGRVFRIGSLVAKFFEEKSRWQTYLRTPGALRAAQLGFELLPLRSPRPLLAVESTGALRGRPSLLLSEFVEGRLLSEAWHDDAGARADLPHYLAEMHRRDLLHGDLHPMNLIRDDGQWVLLDLTALRRGLHVVFGRRRLILGQWIRLVAFLRDWPRLEEAFATYHALGQLRGHRATLWSEIHKRATVLAARLEKEAAERRAAGISASSIP